MGSPSWLCILLVFSMLPTKLPSIAENIVSQEIGDGGVFNQVYLSELNFITSQLVCKKLLKSNQCNQSNQYQLIVCVDCVHQGQYLKYLEYLYNENKYIKIHLKMSIQKKGSH